MVRRTAVSASMHAVSPRFRARIAKREWKLQRSGTTDDRVMGFPDVAKFYLQQSYHMANNFTEVMFAIQIKRKTQQ